MALGVVVAAIALVFVARKIGSEGAVKVGYGKFAIENASNAALIFVVGIGLVVLAASKMTPDAKPDATHPTGSNVASEQVPDGRLFTDHFDQTALDARWQIVSGDWRVQAGRLIGRGRAADGRSDRAWALLTLDQNLPDDYTVAVRVRLKQANLAEIMVRLAGGRYVRVYLYDIDQDVVLGKGAFTERQAPGALSPQEVQASLGGGASLVQKSFPVQRATWYRLRVTVRGLRYRISVGGQELIDFRDTRGKLSRKGTIGLLSNGEVEFDDVVVDKA